MAALYIACLRAQARAGVRRIHEATDTRNPVGIHQRLGHNCRVQFATGHSCIFRNGPMRQTTLRFGGSPNIFATPPARSLFMILHVNRRFDPDATPKSATSLVRRLAASAAVAAVLSLGSFSGDEAYASEPK